MDAGCGVVPGIPPLLSGVLPSLAGYPEPIYDSRHRCRMRGNSTGRDQRDRGAAGEPEPGARRPRRLRPHARTAGHARAPGPRRGRPPPARPRAIRPGRPLQAGPGRALAAVRQQVFQGMGSVTLSAREWWQAAETVGRRRKAWTPGRGRLGLRAVAESAAECGTYSKDGMVRTTRFVLQACRMSRTIEDSNQLLRLLR